MRVFPVRGNLAAVHAKNFLRRRAIHRSCGEQLLRALLASMNNSGLAISPGQSESASDALGQPSIKFPSPERAAQNLAGCRPLTALKNKAVLWKDKFLADATASGRDFFKAALFPDDILWDDCAAQWGTGFLVAVSSRVREWCESH